MYRSSVLVLLITLLQKSTQTPVAELKSVVVLYRHGDRAPVSTYPNDPYGESYWPYGFGELTNIGKNQHYELGQFFRDRYSNFLSREYNKSDIQVQSSNVNRCLMSAGANLAGLYPPVGYQVWNPQLLWQPIPAHTTPEVDDAYLAQGEPCPKYNNLYNELLETEEFQQLFKDNAKLIDYLSEHSGQTLITLTDTYLLYDTLFIETLYNLTLPDWAQKAFFGWDGQYKKLSQAFWAPATYTPELARLKAGPLIDLITSQLENVTYSTGTPKFLMLSAHDSTVANLLNSLHIFDYESPPYASTVILELREGRENYFVNIFYKKFDTILELTLPGCDFDCDFDLFRQIVAPVRIGFSDWLEECRVW